MTLVEVEGIMKQIGRNVPDHTQILFGVAVEPKLGDSVAVTLISSLGAEALQSYSQAQTATRLEPEAPASNEPAPKPAGKASSPPPLPRSPEPEEDAAPKAKTGADAFDLFAASAASAVATAPVTTSVFQEVTTEVTHVIERSVRVDAEIPDEVTFEESETPEAVEENEAEPEVVAPMAETTSVPLPAARPQAAPVVTARERSEPLAEPTPAPARHTGGLLANVIGGSGSAATPDSDMFQAGDEGRGRFKNTEPSLVEGEDLDVPTWMRLKKKLSR
jgi:cell division protein FtsZ